MMAPARKEPDASTYSGRFAIRLRELRDKVKLSQLEAAEKIGVSQHAISSWEIGRTSPPIETYPVMASVYKLKHVRELMPLD